MIRHWTLVVASIVVGCSSESDPACVVDGTYSVTSVRESGDCPEGGGEPVTDTFTTLPDGRVKLEIQGLPDLVPVGRLNGCQWTAALRFIATDATGPENVGTLQYSYTFTRSGLSGILSRAVPATPGLPNGCRGTVRVTGTRR